MGLDTRAIPFRTTHTGRDSGHRFTRGPARQIIAPRVVSDERRPLTRETAAPFRPTRLVIVIGEFARRVFGQASASLSGK